MLKTQHFETPVATAWGCYSVCSHNCIAFNNSNKLSILSTFAIGPMFYMNAIMNLIVTFMGFKSVLEIKV